MNIEDQLICVDSLQLAIRRYSQDSDGEKTPVFLLHGAGRTLEDWHFVAPHLGPHIQAIAVDLRGHGRSAEEAWTWDELAQDIEQLAQTLGYTHYAVAGHSLGGMVASLCAAKNTNCLAAINLDGHGMGHAADYSGIDKKTAEERLQKMRAFTKQFAPAPEQTISAQDRQNIETQLQQGDNPDWAKTAFARSLKQLANGQYAIRPTHDAFMTIQDQLDELDLYTHYSNSRCPLLIVQTTKLASQDDPSMEHAMACGLEWLADMQNAYLKGLSQRLKKLSAQHNQLSYVAVDSGHGVTLEEPEIVARLINQHIAGVKLKTH